MKKILAMLTLITLFVSCQKGSENPMEPTFKRVRISPKIVRATELSFEQGDKVGMTIIKEDQSKHADNVLMTYTNGIFVGDVAWYEGPATSKMMAYYPYSSTGIPTSFSVSADQTTGYGASDLMGALKSDVSPTDNAVGMTFNHLLSKIVVNVKQTDTDIASVVLQNSIPTATIDLTTMTVAADQTAAVVDISAQAVAANSSYRAILIPQTVALTIAITTTQGKTLTRKLSSAIMQTGGQYSADVEIENNQLKVRMSGDIENWTNEGGLGAEEDTAPSDYELRVLTFEDEDYKGPDNASYWTSLIDNPQYNGPLLYGDHSDANYKWSDDNNTFIAHKFPYKLYWSGGHAISNYVELDLKKGNHESQLAIYYKNSSTGYGGHNGSKNFCVHYGHFVGSLPDPAEITEILPSFYFKDGTARVVDHMYVMINTYLANCILNGNGLTEPCGPDDWVKVVAIGFDSAGNRTKELEFSLTTGVLGKVMENWQKWDLSSLGKVSRVVFNVLGSSDNGFGSSQPAYFAYDDVAVRFEK